MRVKTIAKVGVEMKKKHVLLIVENNTVPYDIRVWSEALALKEFGYAVTVISPKNKKAPLKIESIKDISILRHSQVDMIGGKFSFILEYCNALFWEFFLSLKIFTKNPFHVIHTASPPDLTFLVALFYKLFRVKFIFDHHDLSPELYLSKFCMKRDVVYHLLRLFEKLSCKLADVIISTNETYKGIVINRNCIDPKKVFVVRNDPKVTNILVENNKKDENEKKTILYLGSINSQDGVDILVRALHYLVNVQNEKKFICQIVGDGDSLQDVKQIVKELHLSKFINFNGFIYQRDKIFEFIHSSDICVESAPENELNKHSTFIKIMEYMNAGKPIVAFDLAETRFSAGNSAILVKPGCEKELAKAIKKLIDNRELREKLGEAGRDRIINELNWNNSSKKLQKAYNSLRF